MSAETRVVVFPPPPFSSRGREGTAVEDIWRLMAAIGNDSASWRLSFRLKALCSLQLKECVVAGVQRSANGSYLVPCVSFRGRRDKATYVI